VLMDQTTPGSLNTYPKIGPVVINEVMYRPASDGDAEYVELMNMSDGAVTLFDFSSQEPWRFIDEAGIEFSFPTDVPVTLQSREYLLLARDLSLVHRLYNVPANVQAFEWDSGKLSNSGERLLLLKPGDVDNIGTRYWIDVDSVSYSDGSHGEDFADGRDRWPTEADGLGPSLNRMFWSRYGDDPNNWQATIPTPGATND
jgi:Lamin Tail Domain